MWGSDDDSDDDFVAPVEDELDHGHTHGYTRAVHPVGNMDRGLPQGYSGGIQPEGYTAGRYLPEYIGQEHTQRYPERVHNTQYTEQVHPQEYTGRVHTPKNLEVLDVGAYIGGVHTPKKTGGVHQEYTGQVHTPTKFETLDAGGYIGGVHTPKKTGGVYQEYTGQVHTPTKLETLIAGQSIGREHPKEYTGRGKWDGSNLNNQGRPSTEKNNDGNNNNESALSNNWLEYFDRGSGKFYYYNCVSKVSQWEKPGEWIDRNSVVTPKTQLPDPHLENWKQEVLKVFPEVELQFLERRLKAYSGPNIVNLVCEELLETPDYPKSRSEPAETVVKPEEEKIECGCCCTEHAFEDMVQCTEGHLFCTDCLLRLVTAAADGSGKTNLSCMSTNGCQGTYPQSVIEKAVPNETLRRYEERVREENLNRAGMSNLVRCPHCNYAAVMENDDTTFPCQNKECMKVTCRHCKEDWNNHVGLTCDQLEKKDETKLRKRYEERMTAAKVRTCHGCKSKFTKEGKDCNKMTCTCGATMCYICRAHDIDYGHFCQHLREPGRQCSQCTRCSLWTNPDEDDERAIKLIKRRAQKRRKEEGYNDYKAIGAPSEPKAKKILRS